MSKFQCVTCERIFNKNSHLTSHKNKKNKCKPIIEDPPNNTNDTPINTKNVDIVPPPNTKNAKIDKFVPPPNTILTEFLPNPTQDNKLIKNDQLPLQTEILVDSFPCEYCKKCFARKDSVTKHIKISCPVIKQQNKEKQDIFERLLLLETKNKQLEEEIKNRDDAIKNKDDAIKTKDDVIKSLTNENKILQTITVNNNTNNNNCNNTININIVSHGNENLLERQVGELMLMLAAKRGVNIVDELITLVHFNPAFPEFQNIYLPDMKNNHMMVYENEWKLKNAAVAIKELFDNKSSFIIDNIKDILSRLTIREQAVINKWLILISDNKSKEYKKYYDEILDDIKYNLHNNRKMITEKK